MIEWNIELIQEMSFQGGDGYQYFMNHDLALASISRIIEFCFNEENFEKLDPLYQSIDFSSQQLNDAEPIIQDLDNDTELLMAYYFQYINYIYY